VFLAPLVSDLGDILPTNSPYRGYLSVGVAVKLRQLARQIGVFIEHPPENSIVLFNFASAMPDESTASVFGFCFYIADDGGGFSSHLAETREPTEFAPVSCRDIDDLADNFSGI
jgi:hypothetical protein